MQRDTLTQEPYRSEVRPQQEEDTIDLLELCMGLLDHWSCLCGKERHSPFRGRLRIKGR